MSRRSLASWLAVLCGVSACTSATTPPADGTSAPRSMALVCVLSDGTQAELTDPNCTDSRLFALVGGGSKGTLALASISSGAWFDQDKSIPGYTPLMLAGPPVAIAVSAASQEALVLVPTAGLLQRVDLSQIRTGKLTIKASLPLSAEAADLIVTDEVPPRVVVSDPQQARLLQAPLAEVQASAAPNWQSVAVGGSPGDLAWVAAADQLWVGHQRHGFVSILGGAGLQPVASPLSLVPACRNGLDDDGDGLTDRADSGCDHENDDSEAGPERGTLCGNGVDDDGDGQTDSEDGGCATAVPSAALVADACRNGIDDDGDGLTDYPADRGCSGWGDGDERSDNPGCSNGLDDDDDGLTDGADSECKAGATSEFGAPSLPAAAEPACSNGSDDDGDGLADLDDPDCYNRRSAAEVSADRSPGTLVTASLDGRFVVVVDRSARLAQVADVAGLDWMWPQATGAVPWLRPSALDTVQRIRGVWLTALPLSVAPLLHDGRQAVALGQAGGSVQILRLEAEAAVAATESTPAQPAVPGIHVLTSLDLTSDPTSVVSAAGLAELRLGTTTVDLASTIPSRYAALAPTRTTGAGVTLTDDSNSHRTEIWRLVYEGKIAGTDRQTGHFVRQDQLLDRDVDYCALGVMAGDWLLVDVPACGASPGQTLRYRIAAVAAETLTLAASGGELDVAVTADNQLSFDPAARTAVGLPQPTCFAPYGVRYHVRSGGWLVSGSRTGLLSRRDSRDGLCRDSDTAFLSAARAQEATLKSPTTLPACPMTDAALDTALQPAPLVHPVFSVQLRPGCAKVADGSGALVTKLVPSIRDAQWAFVLSARLQPVTFNLGAAPVVLESAAALARLYALDQGSGGLLGMSISARSLDLSLQ